MTDVAVQYYDEGSSGRLVVHYMQPHFPSIPRPEFNIGMDLDRVGYDEDDWEGSVWNRLEQGELDVEPVREAYEANLRYVLDEVDVLASALDGNEIVVTADHGNAFDGPYGHPIESSAKPVREVPWCVVSGVDDPSREPQNIDVTREAQEVDVEERLSALGYKE